MDLVNSDCTVEFVHALYDGPQGLLVGESEACLVMETILTPLRRSMDLKATSCSPLRVKLENFQTSITSKGTF